MRGGEVAGGGAVFCCAPNPSLFVKEGFGAVGWAEG